MPTVTGTLLRLMLPSFVLLALIIGSIRAQPYDDGRLGGFLDDETCDLPCFMGIRPRVTTAAEAIAIVDASPWVESYQEGLRVQDSFYIRWAWSGRQPNYLQADSVGSISIGNGNVLSVGVQSGMSLGDIWLLIGTSYWEQIRKSDQQRIGYIALYFQEDLQLWVSTNFDCPFDLKTLWETEIGFSLTANELLSTGYYTPLEIMAQCRS